MLSDQKLKTARGQYRDLVGGGTTYWAVKRTIDVAASIALLPLVATVCAVLILLRLWMSIGPVFDTHLLMGQNLRPFTAIKFRLPQTDGILTRFGGLLQRYRIDDLPLIISVLRGNMSLVGPRPVQFEVAREFPLKIPGFHQRLLVRPGITGLAQVSCCRAGGTEAVKEQINADLTYVRNASAALDLRVIWLTLVPA